MHFLFKPLTTPTPLFFLVNWCWLLKDNDYKDNISTGSWQACFMLQPFDCYFIHGAHIKKDVNYWFVKL